MHLGLATRLLAPLHTVGGAAPWFVCQWYVPCMTIMGPVVYHVGPHCHKVLVGAMEGDSQRVAGILAKICDCNQRINAQDNDSPRQ